MSNPLREDRAHGNKKPPAPATPGSRLNHSAPRPPGLRSVAVPIAATDKHSGAHRTTLPRLLPPLLREGILVEGGRSGRLAKLTLPGPSMPRCVRPLYDPYTTFIRPLYGWHTGLVRPFNPQKMA